MEAFSYRPVFLYFNPDFFFVLSFPLLFFYLQHNTNIHTHTHHEKMTMDYQEIREKYENAGQGHVFTFFEQLSSIEQEAFLAQLSKINVAEVTKTGLKAMAQASHLLEKQANCDLEPIPQEVIGDALSAKRDEWYQKGLELIGKNQVAVILMAGGQGTRLGSSDPKGCYDIGLPSHKSLFQLQAERICRLQKLAAAVDNKEVVIPWYIMTSGPTDAPTREFFEKYDCFGLKKENVIFFEQGVIPCFTLDGKFMLQEKGKVCSLLLVCFVCVTFTNQLIEIARYCT